MVQGCPSHIIYENRCIKVRSLTCSPLLICRNGIMWEIGGNPITGHMWFTLSWIFNDIINTVIDLFPNTHQWQCTMKCWATVFKVIHYIFVFFTGKNGYQKQEVNILELINVNSKMKELFRHMTLNHLTHDSPVEGEKPYLF
jgi:hypothetical protein